MKQLLFLCCIPFAYFCISCKSQSKIALTNNGVDTTRIYIYGFICAYQTKEPIVNAYYIIHPTDTGNINRGSVRNGISDKFGRYKIDITTLVDSTNILVIRSKDINCALSHIILKGKIKKSIPFDIELIYGQGNFTREYKIKTKNSKLKLMKQTIDVSSGGMY
jgi:hypothetical protein